MIVVGDKPAVLVQGDFHPAEMYKGDNKIAGCNTVTNSAPHLEFDRTYNSAFNELIVSGKSNQDSTTGKNLFDSSNANTYTVQNGFSVNSAENGVITAETTRADAYLWNTAAIGTSYNTTVHSNKIPISSGQTIACSISDSRISKNMISWFGSDGVSLGFDFKLTNPFIAIAPEGAAFATIRVGDGNATIGEVYNFTIQIEYGTVPTTHEPYTGGAPSPSTDYPQPFVDSYGTLTDGHSVVTIPSTMQGVSYRVTPGRVEKTEEWAERITIDDGWKIGSCGSAGYIRFYSYNNPLPRKGASLEYCDSFQCYPKSSYWPASYGEGLYYGENSPTVFDFAVKRDRIASLDEWIAFIKTNPITVRYQLAAPITTDITNTDLGQQLLKLACYHGGTTISQNCNIPLSLSATAKTY